MVRLYVGGLPPDIKPNELSARFTPFGKVESCELIPPKSGWLFTANDNCRGFAYVELTPKDEVSLSRCLSLVSMKFSMLYLHMAQPCLPFHGAHSLPWPLCRSMLAVLLLHRMHHVAWLVCMQFSECKPKMHLKTAMHVPRFLPHVIVGMQ